MKLSKKDRVEGKLHEAQGAAKERVGRATNNPELFIKGRNEKAAGKIQKKLGQIEKVFEN